MRTLALILVVAACAGPPPDEPPPFVYRARFGWHVDTAPAVTRVTVDDVDLPSGAPYSVVEQYPSYGEALTQFATRRIVAYAGDAVVLRGDLGLGECWAPHRIRCSPDETDCPAPIVVEDSTFSMVDPFTRRLVVHVVTSHCEDAAGRSTVRSH